MSYSGMRFVEKLHADYNPCLTPVWVSLTSYTQTTVLLRYEVRWHVTNRLQSISYSGMRFVDKLHTDYNPFLTPVWGSLTHYTQTKIHFLLRYEVRWQVTNRLQSMFYSSMRFVDKFQTDYNPCLTQVWGLLTSYTQIIIHVLFRYEVLTSYTQTTIHVLLRYEVRWQVTHSLKSMSYSGMRLVDKLHTDYNPCLTPVWGSLTSYTQTTIHVLLWYEVFFLHFLLLWNTIQNSIVSDVLYFILFVRKINHTVFTDINVVLWIPLRGWAWGHQTR